MWTNFKVASIFTLKAKCYSENTEGNLKTFLLKSWSCVNSHRSGPFDEVLQPCVAELQADDIVEFFSFGRRCFIVAPPLGHWHLNSLLCVHIHDVYNASTAYKSIDRRFSKWFFFLGIETKNWFPQYNSSTATRFCGRTKRKHKIKITCE